MTPEVSVIIPCYGANKSLKSLATDLTRQSFTDFEAIFINDGDDNQTIVLKDVANMDSRFKIITKQNEGVSSARNVGLDAAKGEYVIFVDADDNLNIDALKILSSQGKNADMVVGGYTTYNLQNKISKSVVVETEGILCTKEAMSYLESNVLLRAVWSKLFKRSVIESNRIKFNQEFNIAEDWLFILEYIYHVDSISFVNDSGYIYNIAQNDSLSLKYDCNHVKVTKSWIDMISKVWEKNGIEEEYIIKKKDKYYAQLCFSLLKNLYCTKKKPSFWNSIMIIKKQLINDHELLRALSQYKTMKKTDIIQKRIINTKNEFVIAALHCVLYTVRGYLRNIS